MNTRKWQRISFGLICLVVLFALNVDTANASPALQMETNFAPIDAYVVAQMTDLGIPGMALGLVQDGQINYLAGFGVTDSSGRAVTPQTPFRIGSVTKSFTALAVMQLVEAGKIDLDAPVQEYLPWFVVGDKEESAKITVRHLLNNTSGISTKDGNRDLLSQRGLEEAVRGYNTVQLTQLVGKTFQYSNLNWNIAGLIVEVASGQSYAEYVTQQIFEPLDMRHSYASIAPAQADGLAAGHHLVLGRAIRSERAIPPAHLPAGFLIASVEDMAHYAVAQLNDGRFGDTAILSPDGMAELHAPAVPLWGELHYAMGWEVGTLDGISVVSHTGDDGSSHSKVILIPERRLGIVLLANASGFEQNPQLNQIAEGVLNLLDGKPAQPVSPPIHYRFLYWGILLMPLMMALGMVYSWQYRRNKGLGPIFLVAFLYGGIALLWLFGVPLVIGQPIWSGMRFLIPELAYGLIAGAAIGMGWSVIFSAMALRTRKTLGLSGVG